MEAVHDDKEQSIVAIWPEDQIEQANRLTVVNPIIQQV